MLYSVTICDLLYKLQELQEVYKDTTAIKILENVKNKREDPNGSKSRWEKQFVDEVYEKTKLLDQQSYTEINHLYAQRNFSAHPAMNENYELLMPSRYTTIAHINNIFDSILSKPPVFTKNVIDMLTNDIADKKDIFAGNDSKFKEYLCNKYFNKMTDSMKLKTFITFWKFCFCKPDSEVCMTNIKADRFVEEILLDQKKDLMDYLKTEEKLKSISNDETCCYHFCMLVSKFPQIYERLSDEIKLCINRVIENDKNVKFFSWFISADKSEHMKKMIEEKNFDITDEEAIEYVRNSYADAGLEKIFCEYSIKCYEKSTSFDVANFRCSTMILPSLPFYTKEQFIELLEVIDDNDQIYNRNAAYSTNTEIIKQAQKYLGKDFDYDQFSNIQFNNYILKEA